MIIKWQHTVQLFHIRNPTSPPPPPPCTAMYLAPPGEGGVGQCGGGGMYTYQSGAQK